MEQMMAVVYAKLVRAGVREIESIPDHLRSAVEKELENETNK
jgi:hypothetical protein